MGITSIKTTVFIFYESKAAELSRHFISRELYRGYIRETIIKPGLQSSCQSAIVDHVKNRIREN